jgi:hypothetical protein
VREIDAGRVQPPPESDLEGPTISISLGDACDVDPELLAAMCGPDGLGGQAVGAAFGQDRAADVLRPGPVLAAVTAQVVSRAASRPDFRSASRLGSHSVSRPDSRSVSRPDSLTDNELIGALQAARRLANLAAYQQTVVIAEFARRRQGQFEAAKAAGKPAGCRDGEFPGEELAMELLDTGPYTAARIDTAIELTTRLPRTLAGMEDGTIDLGRAMTIAARTHVLTDADAACADEVLAAAAPGLRPDQLARKAAALEMRLAPEAVAARRKLARQLGQRVEARREESGNASLSGRELDTADVIASNAYIGAVAAKLRSSGLIGGTIGQLRALALIDLTQGRDPLNRIRPRPAQAPSATPPVEPATDPVDEGRTPEQTTHPAVDNATPSDLPGVVDPDNSAGRDDEAERTGHCDESADDLEDSLRYDPARSASPVPLPALINLLVPAGTLLGWGTAPAEAAGWGLLDANETRTLVRAASQHPRTRWCMTIIAPDGTAIAHGCAIGRHPWPRDQHPWPENGTPCSGSPPDPRSRPDSPPPQARSAQSGTRDAPSSPQQAAQLLDLLSRLNITLEPIARDACDHRNAENRYVPGRKLRHLVHARAQLCTAPACNAQALYCDLDHAVPYPDGPTDQCNLNPKCRRHHRTKQAPGWKVAQPTPDTTTWTTPAGRRHATTPTAYDL